MGEFFDLLPLRTEVSLHVMRDAQLDGNFLRQAGQYLNTAPEAKIRGKMSDDQWAEVSRRAAREYSDQFGDNLHMSWSTACLKGGNAHTKLHLFIYDGGIRVIITSANAMAADFVHGDNVRAALAILDWTDSRGAALLRARLPPPNRAPR
jgi:hypothetical protein